MFPWIQIALPVTVVLEFKETDKDSGLLKIETHEEHWTIEGNIDYHLFSIHSHKKRHIKGNTICIILV